MACELTRGRKEACLDSTGGIKTVYFVDYGDLGTITKTDDEITDLGGTFTAYKYELKGANSFETTINSSRENGTTFFEQSLTIQLKGLSKEDHKEIRLMAYGRPHICVVDYNDNAMLMGEEQGCDVTAGTVSTGTALGDFNGYSLTFTAQETNAPAFLASPTVADPFAGMSTASVTITEGA